MNEKVLMVDDDPNLLASSRRHLEEDFHIDTALGGQEGLEKIGANGPYAVVVSDFKMPKMNGVEFLSQVREVSPESVRMMLTGYADIQTATKAVNEGNVFRLLTKPCMPEVLKQALNVGIEQNRLINAEKELLEKTLSGSIKVLSEVLSLLNPEACGRASRITRYVREIAYEMKEPDAWKIETAAMLSQIGCIILPENVLNKIYIGQNLTEEESQLFNMHPSIASDLLSKIPRMEEVAEIIAYQEKLYDGSGIPHDQRKGKDIPLGARILKVALDFDMLVTSGFSKGKALGRLEERSGFYDPSALTSLKEIIGIESKYEIRSVSVKELKEQMILNEDITSRDGLMLMSKGQEVSRTMIKRLSSFSYTTKIKEPIKVLVPLTDKAALVR
jgi:response regulator RpfG family c-di-GMP phosphodiesterase